MSKLTSTQRTRLEVALMGRVVSCDEDAVDLVEATRYLLSATQGIHKKTEEEMNETAEEAVRGIHKYDEEGSKNRVRFLAIGFVYDMLRIIYFIDTGDEYSPCHFLDPVDLVKVESRRIGDSYYWFSYTYNVSVPEFSELRDSFVARKSKISKEVVVVS